MKRQSVGLIVWLVVPVLLVAALIWAIGISTPERGRIREQFPPVGAGADHTGGVNAVGELLAGNKANHGTPQGRAAETPPPVLVQPEDLPQGFILVVEDGAKRATQASPIYLAGTVNNWNPGDPSWRLEAQSDGKWRIHVRPPADGKPIEFKFTRGTWDLEELNADLTPPSNRTLEKVDVSTLAAGRAPVIPLRVERWGDERVPKPAPSFAVAAGDLRRLEVQGGAFDRGTREVLVWVPPGYDDPANAGRTYPVLYMHDGQNLFQPGPFGDWKIDEAATDLLAHGAMSPIIIVGIPHLGELRVSEYLPVDALDGVEPRGTAHVEWLLREVLPRVERAFRVATGPKSTAVGGSSLGAAVSLHAAMLHPEVFGIVLAESLPLATGNAKAWDDWVASYRAWPQRVYLGMGGAEAGKNAPAERNAAYVSAVRALDDRLKRAGLGPSARLCIVEPDAEHNEAAWSRRLPQALTFLFPPPMDSSK
jgi:enterochelin esterase-like enzyme